MENFSRIGESFEIKRTEAAERAELQPVQAFTEREKTPSATARRVKKAMSDFWFFDKTYFSPEQYQEFAEPCQYHEQILQEILTPGVTVHAGPREFGKSAYGKKIHAWLLLTGQNHILALLSYTLPVAQNMVRDMAALILDNDRMAHDFNPVFLEANSDQFAFRTLTKNMESTRVRYAAAFSEGRSVRGFTRKFSRPERAYADDMETLASPLGGEHTERRIALLSESFASLSGNKKTLWCCGNNFDTRGFINDLLEQQEKGLLKDGWRVSVNRAFSNGKSLWPAKYPASDEQEMMRLIKPRSISDFNANWQQKPTPPEGHIFTRKNLKFWDKLPRDARGVIYTDQNLALKSKGDTTAIVSLVFSPTTGKMYLSARCKSYAEPGDLLGDMLRFRAISRSRIARLGMDGNVSQESHWRSHIRAWCKENKALYPHVSFCRYNVDEIATNFKAVYGEGLVEFDPAMNGSEEGSRFFEQFFAFKSKKEKRKDDAPDASICAYQLLTETGLSRTGGRSAYAVVSFNEDTEY